MLCLNIRTTDARIGIETSPGKLNVRAPIGQWNNKTELGQCNLSVGKTEIEYNSDAYNECLGLYKPEPFARKYAQEGRQGLYKGISNHLNLAKMFNRATPGSNVIAQIGKQAIAKQYELVVGLKLTPEMDIKVHQEGLQGQNDVGSLKQEYVNEPFEGDYTPAVVNTYLKQQGSVRMWVTEGKYDIYA